MMNNTAVVNTGRVWSRQQNDIFDWFEHPERNRSKNLVVEARAGTGKTTTIIEGANRAPEQKILLAAFNKRIQEELTSRLANPKARAQTLHSVGFGAVRDYWTGVRIGEGSTRADDLTEQVCGPHVPDAVKRLVSKLHTKGREIVPHATKLPHLIDIAYNFECEPDEEWVASGFHIEFVTLKALEAMDLAAHVKPTRTGIDFADMIFLPVRNHWLRPQYDLVIVDEAQDMTVAQLEIAEGVSNGRIAVVGDSHQAIYGFRGADSNSLSRLRMKLNADERKLTITYRCGTAIVEKARKLVPDFEAGPNNPTGVVSGLEASKLTETAAHGDFVLSRLNAPLTTVAMSLLRNGKRARIAGRDIGHSMKSLIRKLKGKNRDITIEELVVRLEAWRTREASKFAAANREAQVDAVHDKANTLLELMDGADDAAHLESRIDALFTDDGLGQAGVITCSSVHRAKGLEANRVFVLASTLYVRGWSQEEENIEYVAITRAKNELVLVTGE